MKDNDLAIRTYNSGISSSEGNQTDALCTSFPVWVLLPMVNGHSKIKADSIECLEWSLSGLFFLCV